MVMNILFLEMQKFISSLLVFILIAVGQVSAQNSKDFQIHSHNDYLQTVPFWTAYSAGASSIEVDLILKDGKLIHRSTSIYWLI